MVRGRFNCCYQIFIGTMQCYFPPCLVILSIMIFSKLCLLCISLFIIHVLKDSNQSATDWIASFVTNHFRTMLWTNLKIFRGHFVILFFLIFLVVFMLELYIKCTSLSKKKKKKEGDNQSFAILEEFRDFKDFIFHVIAK